MQGSGMVSHLLCLLLSCRQVLHLPTLPRALATTGAVCVVAALGLLVWLVYTTCLRLFPVTGTSQMTLPC